MTFEDFKTDPSWDDARLHDYRSFHREIWHEAEYEKHDVGIMPGDRVVDCGASIGIFARYAIHRGAGSVTSVEADKSVYDYLKLNAKGHSITPLQGTVGGDWDIESIMSAGGIDGIDFLKVDIEGWEFDLFNRTSDETLAKVAKIAMEVHLYGVFEYISDDRTAADSCLRLTRLLERLTGAGFRLSFERAHPNTCLFMVYAKR